MLFELTGGNHQQGGKTYKKGDRIETDMDLCAKFRGKFKLIEGEAAKPITQPVIPKTEFNVNTVKKLASGMDMTATFPSAKEKSLIIMKVGEDQFQIAKNGFIEVVGTFTRAEIIIFLKSLNA